MMLNKRHYAELLHLTELYLLREYSLKESKIVDPAVFAFFQTKMKYSSIPVVPRKIPQPPAMPIPPVQMTKAPNPPNPSPTIPPSPDPQPPLPPQPPQPRPEPPPQEPLPPPTQPEPVTPPQRPPIIQEKTGKSKEFVLEPLPAPPPHDQREFWKICPTLFPDWLLCETLPNDEIAQKNKNAWLREQEIAPVMILSFHDHEQQVTFLKNIAQAISLRLAPARIVSASKLEKENAWEHLLNSPRLQLVIASDYGLYLQPKLMRFYREVPQQGKHFLHQTPLLLLSDLSLYLKEPQLKPLLWRAICNEFTRV
jgi:hypothetical protein